MRTVLFCCLCFLSTLCYSQTKPDKDSITYLNNLRLNTNVRGMNVLSGWGTINTLAGGIGFFAANDEEWKAFHGMNAIWGVTNLGIGLMGRAGVKRERAMDLSCGEMLHRYESTKRLFLINAGLDVAYIGTGVFLKEHGKTKTNAATWKGFGNSLSIQGAFLLLFDGTMYVSHQGKDKRWYRLLSGLCVTGNGVTLNYTF